MGSIMSSKKSFIKTTKTWARVDYDYCHFLSLPFLLNLWNSGTVTTIRNFVFSV